MTMTNIRALTKNDDLGDLLALSREFFQEYEAYHDDLFGIDQLRDSDIVDFFSRSLDSADSATFVAIDQARMIGYVTVSVRRQPGFYKVKRVGAISGLMVDKAYRRRGVGGRLLEAVESFLRDRGVIYFTLYTAAANESALRFYRRRHMAPLSTTMVARVTGPAAEGALSADDRAL